MWRLARLAEPWRIEESGDGLAVCDANGVVLVRLSRQGGDAVRPATELSDAEADELAHLIARLPVLSRRPQY